MKKTEIDLPIASCPHVAVGQTVYLMSDMCLRSDKPQTCTVTSIGTKYVTVSASWRTYRFKIEDGSHYDPDFGSYVVMWDSLEKVQRYQNAADKLRKATELLSRNRSMLIGCPETVYDAINKIYDLACAAFEQTGEK